MTRILTRSLVFGALAALVLPQAAYAIDVTVGGQYRPRAEVANKTLGGGAEDVFVSHRARIELGLSADRWGVQIDPQHVLTWGTEGSTLALGSGTLDFHQAYAYVKIGEATTLQIGRQEIAYDDHRILGTVDWTQQARSFDAGRASFDGGGTLAGDLFAALLSENGTANETLVGGRLDVRPEGLTLGIPVYAEYAARRANGDADFLRITPGARLTLAPGGFQLDVAAYGQFGQVTVGGVDFDYTAYMAAVRAGYTVDDTVGTFTVGADMLSGDGDPADTTYGTFDTLFATNHKFYGHMDYFLAIPTHTGQLGLTDVLLTWQTGVVPKLKTTLTGHMFLATQESAAQNRDFGYEVDLGLGHKLSDVVGLSGGYSLFVAGEAMVDIGRAGASGDLGHWAYLQLDVNL